MLELTTYIHTELFCDGANISKRRTARCDWFNIQRIFEDFSRVSTTQTYSFFFFPAQIFLSHIVTNLCLLLLLSRGHSLWLCRLGTALQSNIKFSIIKERKFKNNFRGWRLFSSIRFTSCTFAYIWISIIQRRAFAYHKMVSYDRFSGILWKSRWMWEQFDSEKVNLCLKNHFLWENKERIITEGNIE